ncbi:hypothetical protein [Aquimarina algiphila]|uniref:hypothetical protein n=1 Tax=Aquimarina algiphila TaxID=2047982 RepID=UPI00232E4CD6|nr:hypothetical protein [Aquimarina algiphila]
MKEPPLIRKSIYKPYRYDNTINSHAENLEMVFFMMIPLLICSVIMHLSITAWFLPIFGISIIVVIFLFKLYNNLYHRYYRIIKRTEQKGQNEEAVYYIVQSYISYKKPEKIVLDKNIKWTDVESFYSSNGEDPSERRKAELFFDQKTIKNKVDDLVISRVKKSIYKPGFRQKFLEKNNLHIKEIIVPGILLGILSFFLFFKGLLFLTRFPLAPLQTFSILGIVILSIIVVCVLYIRKNHRYLRLVERKESQGRYKKTSYYMQSFISRKGLEKIEDDKNIKWKYYKHNEFRRDLSRENAEYYFNGETTEKKVIDEIL